MNISLRAAAPFAMIMAGAALASSATAASAAGATKGATVDWPQAGLTPAHTGSNSNETTISRKNVGRLTQKWMAGLDGPQIYAQPVEMNGLVYALSGVGDLYAFDATTGQVQWTVAAGLTFNYGTTVSGIIAGKGLVYSPCKVDSDNGYDGGHSGICAYKADSGALVWNYVIRVDSNGNAVDSTLLSQPVLAGSKIFFAEQTTNSQDQTAQGMFALDAATGKMVWGAGVNPGARAPAAADGLIFFENNGGDGYHICALSQATGATAWCSAPYGGFNQNVAVADGVVLFQTNLTDGSGYTQLNALNEKTGNVVWQKTIMVGDNGSPPAVAHGLAYFVLGTNGVGSLYALDVKTGAQAWVYAGGGAAGYLTTYGGVSVANGVAYALCDGGGNGGQCAFDAKTGAVLLSEGNYQDEYDGPAPIVVNGAEIYVCGAVNLCDSAPKTQAR